MMIFRSPILPYYVKVFSYFLFFLSPHDSSLPPHLPRLSVRVSSIVVAVLATIMTWLKCARRRLLCSSLHFVLYHIITLYHHIKYIDQYQLFYHNYDHINLSYSSLCRNRRNFPNRELPRVSRCTAAYINYRFVLYFFAFYLVRCVAILTVPAVTATRQRRVWIASEMFQPDDWYFEICFALWSAMGVAFYAGAMSNRLDEYRFLAVIRLDDDVGDGVSSYIQPRDLQLDSGDFHHLVRFRRRCQALYFAIAGSFAVMCGAAAALLQYLTDGYTLGGDLIIAIVWTVVIILWCIYVSTSKSTAVVREKPF